MLRSNSSSLPPLPTLTRSANVPEHLDATTNQLLDDVDTLVRQIPAQQLQSAGRDAQQEVELLYGMGNSDSGIKITFDTSKFTLLEEIDNEIYKKRKCSFVIGHPLLQPLTSLSQIYPMTERGKQLSGFAYTSVTLTERIRRLGIIFFSTIRITLNTIITQYSQIVGICRHRFSFALRRTESKSSKRNCTWSALSPPCNTGLPPIGLSQP